MRFDPFTKVLNPHTLVVHPSTQFPAVTLVNMWRPLEHMSVEAVLTLISGCKGIIISSSVNDQW